MLLVELATKGSGPRCNGLEVQNSMPHAQAFDLPWFADRWEKSAVG